MYMTKRTERDYSRLKHLEQTGHILTTDGLRFICEAHGYDAEKIGKHFLEILVKWNAEKLQNL